MSADGDGLVHRVDYASPPILEVRDLGVSFSGRVGLLAGLGGRKATEARAVDGVDLQLHRGEVLALAGESGCGKTTTARAMMGLIKPQRGEILFNGQSARQGPPLVPAPGADGLPGPDGFPEPASDDLRDRRGGTAHPSDPPRTGG